MIDFQSMEFFREGYGMLADLRDKDPGAPICFPVTPGGTIMTGHCNCRESRKEKSCRHFSLLLELAAKLKTHTGRQSPMEAFSSSTWFRLAALLSEGDPVLCQDINAGEAQGPAGNAYAFTRSNGALIARFPDASPASLRFVERIGKIPHNPKIITRADLLQRLASYQCSKEEQQLNKAGMLTRRQAAEQSFWGRLAYHVFREHSGPYYFRPKVDPQNGDFLLACLPQNADTVVEISIPRLRVRKVLSFLASEFPDQPGLAIHPIPLKSIFHVTQTTKLDLEVRPMIQALQASGEASFYRREDFAKFRYGDLVYIQEMNLLAELEPSDAERKFASPVSMNLKKSQLPSFLDEQRQDIKAGNLVLDAPLRELSIFKDFDRIEISMNTLQRSWYWLSVNYGFGNSTVSLREILEARREGKNYLETAEGWVDLYCDALKPLEEIEKQKPGAAPKSRQGIPVSPANLLRLLSSSPKPVQIAGEDRHADLLNRLLALAPSKPWTNSKGLATKLRPYQVRGVDWLRFLSENELGGLMCDDMGLGKTHQAMALMVWLKETQKAREPFLVVCPTTVISHWRDKLRDHAPGLKAIIYHGDKRELGKKQRAGEVILTSYGVLRNDVGLLKEIPLSLAVFDEIQNLKNKDTLGYQAAALIQAKMRIGLTGTPIENSLAELKSLFDLVLPGYLGADEAFASRYAAADASPQALPQLKRIISPFTLRRLKKDVLEELPEKIEDVRACQLSETQVKLYREALAAKGAPLLSQLESNPRQLPYIHIFALLNLLKRICDHPALALNQVENYESFESGKWDLFKELLFETLENGQKIVVFTQYLGMIAMMERFLGSQGIRSVSLTGASQNRGEIIRRFSEDPDCRVFLGSLKAGGIGIDLVSGSTVLHYDRWWNAAREDQATDRVHRIGQKRAVQVFKLVTEGTLEEKISAIIERKRQLMNSVIETDDPKLSKIFTREELIELLKPL